MAPTAILIATLIGACVLIISYKLDSSRHYLLGASERLPPHFGGDVHRAASTGDCYGSYMASHSRQLGDRPLQIQVGEGDGMLSVQRKPLLGLLVAIRDRQHELELFLNHMHNHLSAAGQPYIVVVAEQLGRGPFNRGVLLNAAFLEARRHLVAYVALHDVDALPLLGVDYTLPAWEGPRHAAVGWQHLASEPQQFGWRLPHEGHCGGAVLASAEAFEGCNGYSNGYFGWGGEDDDLCLRLSRHMHALEEEPAMSGLHVPRPPRGTGRFSSVGSQLVEQDRMEFRRANLARLTLWRAAGGSGSCREGLSDIRAAEEAGDMGTTAEEVVPGVVHLTVELPFEMAPGLVALPERMFRPDEAAEVAAAPAVQEARGYLTQLAERQQQRVAEAEWAQWHPAPGYDPRTDPGLLADEARYAARQAARARGDGDREALRGASMTADLARDEERARSPGVNPYGSAAADVAPDSADAGQRVSKAGLEDSDGGKSSAVTRSEEDNARGSDDASAGPESIEGMAQAGGAGLGDDFMAPRQHVLSGTDQMADQPLIREGGSVLEQGRHGADHSQSIDGSRADSGNSDSGNDGNDHGQTYGVWVEADDIEALAGSGSTSGDTNVGVPDQRSTDQLSQAAADAVALAHNGGDGAIVTHGNAGKGEGVSIGAEVAPGAGLIGNGGASAAVTVEHLGLAAQAFWQRQQGRKRGRVGP
mmetsp:Transcript_10030/g.30052  ORF Transcript_10030/g.30052 Transcript_10030/m.30052 type:complete len:703 (-) Transcript_10030:206-2314(-)